MPTSASTLSLGQASFILGTDSLNFGTPVDQLRVQKLTSASSATQSYFTASKTGSTIENLTLDTALSPGASSTNVSFGSAVSGLNANLGDGVDTLSFSSTVTGSSIQMDASPTSLAGGADRFVANGGFFESTVSTGAGNDTLLFAKEVIDSTIDTGDGNDVVTFNAGSFVSNTTVATGAGNDNVTFQGVVFGDNGPNSQISLGGGADTLVFGANSYVSGYRVDLGGSDSSVDKVFFNGAFDESGSIQITGASDGDVLVIGSGSEPGTYTYTAGVFVDGSDTLTLFS